MSSALLFWLQASLPAAGIPYNARIDYQGPGIVCGAAFSFELQKGETATLLKSSFIDAKLNFVTVDGQFSISESQYANEGGKIVRRIPDGSLKRFWQTNEYRWSFIDGAPGSTDVYGPAVKSASPTRALERVKFGSPRNATVGKGHCLAGIGSEPRTS